MTTEQSTPAPRRRNRALTRAALLDAAATVFARNGFKGASLDEISETAGFTRGAFHHHFASKEELFLAVIARHDEELLAGYGSDDEAGIPPDPGASAARWEELHRGDRDDTALRLELRSLALREPEVRRQLAAVERAAVKATADRFAESAAGQGATWRYPPEQIATLFHLMSSALSVRAALGEGDTEELMQTFLTLMWEGSLQSKPATKSR